MIFPKQTHVNLSFKMSLRSWKPQTKLSAKPPILLIHGLGSNAKTWDGVGRCLAEASHKVVAIDQRNHGLSDKTESGFDFATITADLIQLLDYLKWDQPILVGQSWGGNVLTEFGARYPGRSTALVMVDGGFLDFAATGQSWETLLQRLTPPNIDRFPAETMRYLIQSSHPDWSDEGLDGTMANFEIFEDGLIQRRLEIVKHREILRHLFDQSPQELYLQIKEPVLICAAGPGETPDAEKQAWLDQTVKIQRATLKWFSHTDHDIHVQKPQELSKTILDWLGEINHQQ